MSAVETLIKARELIARPGGWTTEVEARDRDGTPVMVCDPSAVCWCAYGAIWRVYGSTTADHVESFLVSAIKGRYVDEWNDDPDRTQSEVVQAFDRAIALAQAEATP